MSSSRDASLWVGCFRVFESSIPVTASPTPVLPHPPRLVPGLCVFLGHTNRESHSRDLALGLVQHRLLSYQTRPPGRALATACCLRRCIRTNRSVSVAPIHSPGPERTESQPPVHRTGQCPEIGFNGIRRDRGEHRRRQASQGISGGAGSRGSQVTCTLGNTQ